MNLSNITSCQLFDNMDLAITSLGMVSSVGYDVATACAAIRAGLSRPVGIPYFSVLEEETHESMPLIGHPIRALTDGFSSVGQWLQMAQTAFRDLLRFGGIPDKDNAAFWQKTGMTLVTPMLDDSRFMYVPYCQPEQIEDTYLKPLLVAMGCPILPENVNLVSEGHRGALQAVAEADTFIHDRHLERLLVLAADSYLDAMSLSWLAEFDRLKTKNKPTGLIPGEAAVGLLLEPYQKAVRRGAKVLAKVKALALEKEKCHYFSDQPNQGRAMAKTITAALSVQSSNKPFAGDLIIDLNGENWRAYEFGTAVTQVPQHLLGEYHLLTPAISVGDTGAASGALNIALAARALDRDYATSASTIIVASSDYGEVGTLIIENP